VLLQKKERGRKNKKIEEVPAVQKESCCWKRKLLLLKQKKERKSKKERKREKQKVSIRAAVLSLFFLFCVTTLLSRLTSLSKV
jgi:hypothetical protein